MQFYFIEVFCFKLSYNNHNVTVSIIYNTYKVVEELCEVVNATVSLNGAPLKFYMSTTIPHRLVHP